MANKEKGGVSKSVTLSLGLMVPIIYLFYLVVFLKELGVTRQSYFENYDNALTVWSVGLDFFKTFMNSLDSITSVLAQIYHFFVGSIYEIITYLTNLVDGINPGSWFDQLAEWARNVIGSLMF